MGQLIVIEQFSQGKLAFALEKDLMPLIGERLGELFQSAVQPRERGLYVVSENAGFQSAVQFWGDARRSGVAVANPELFPWTLANAPCGWLARHFQVTGPNYTFTGQSEALRSALSQAAGDLRAGCVQTAWVVAIDFARKPSGKAAFAALRLAMASPEMQREKALDWLSGARLSSTQMLLKQKGAVVGGYLNL